MVFGCFANSRRSSSLMPWKTAEAPPLFSISSSSSTWSSSESLPRLFFAASTTLRPLSDLSFE